MSLSDRGARGKRVMRDRIMVLIPTLNEAVAIGPLLDELCAVMPCTQSDYRIVVANGPSTDSTQRIVESRMAKDSHIELLSVPLGKGNGVRAAIRWAKGQYDYIFMLDGDGTYSPGNILGMLPLLESTDPYYRHRMGKDWKLQYDIVCGTRAFRAPGAMSRAHVFGNACLTVLANLLYWSTRTDDVCTGMWGFRAGVLEAMPLVAKRFELEADLFSCAAKSNARIYCYSIRYGARANGDRAKLRMWDGILIAWHLIKRRFT